MSTTEDRSDLNTVETEDTVAIDVNAVAKAADTATVDPGAVPGTASPLGIYDPNVPPKPGVSPLGIYDPNSPPKP